MTGSPQVLNAETFGAMLRMLRRKARLTQIELGIQVGYSEAHISRLERDQRTPDPVIVATRFVPALFLDGEPETAARMVQLADQASGGKLNSQHFTRTFSSEQEELEEVGALEMVPAPPTFEVERGEPISRLAALLESQHAAALIGMPGIGKTTLAANLARASRYPVFWFTFNSTIAAPLDTLIRQLALFLLLEGREQVSYLLGTSTPSLAIDQQINILATALTATPCMLCFDDIHELKDELAFDALRRWTRLMGVRTLFISREDVPVSEAMSVRLDGMRIDESQELIRALNGGADQSLIRQIHDLTAGNPMLMRLALGQILASGSSVDTYVEDLALEPMVSAYILDTMLKDLRSDTRQLISWLSLFRNPVDLFQHAVGTALQDVLPSEGNAADAIDESRRRQLIDHPARAALHPLIASHIQHRLTTEPELRRKLHRVAAECCMAGGTGDAIEAAYHLAQADELEQVVDWLTDQVGNLRNRGQATGAAQVVEYILTLPAGPSKQVKLRRRLQALRGDMLVNTLRADEAEQAYREALDLSPRDEVGPVAWSQLALRLANCLMQRTKVHEASELLKDGQALLGESSPLIRMQLAAAMARAQLMTTQLNSAEENARQVLVMVKDVEHFAPRAAAEAGATAHSTLGIILRIRRDYTTSIDHWHQAIHEAQRAGQLDMEYRSMINLAGAYYEEGNLERSMEICEEARSGLVAIGDSYGLARVLNTMALLHHVRGELEQALGRAEQARDLKALIGDQQGWANSEAQCALILLNLGRIEQGSQSIEKVIQATKDTGEQRAQAIYLDSLGLAQTLSGKPETGEKTLSGAMELDVAAEDNRLRGNLENHLAQAYLAQGMLDQAAAIADSPAPEGAGPEVEVERGMVQVMLALANGNPSLAGELGETVSRQADNGGFTLLSRLTRQLMNIDPEAVACSEIPKWGWVLQNIKPSE